MNPQDEVVAHLQRLGADHEIVPCDPALADTAAFCEAYGYSPDDSANTIIVVGKGETPRPVACVVLATTRLDVNGVVRKRLEVRKASFASADETMQLTGMEIGGVTAFGLPDGLPIWIDEGLAQCYEASDGSHWSDRAARFLSKDVMRRASPTAESLARLRSMSQLGSREYAGCWANLNHLLEDEDAGRPALREYLAALRDGNEQPKLAVRIPPLSRSTFANR